MPREFEQAVGERGGSGLEDDRGLDLEQLRVADGGNIGPAGARCDLFGDAYDGV